VVTVSKIVWDVDARSAFKAAYQFIKRDSPQNADKVKTNFIDAVADLKSNPEKHPPDKFRKDKDKSFRAFELNSYRLSYYIFGDTIRVVRFRHVKQAPKEY
jgi:plasmid stabilization system protein ParE